LAATDADSRASAMRGEPGLGVQCAEWLWEHSVAAVAADNYAVEVVPSEHRGAMLPLHLLLIRDMGMTIGEMFNLELLAEACAGDGVYECLFVGTSLKVTGGVGSPITPIAVR
jgi:kynurenine formamidase